MILQKLINYYDRQTKNTDVQIAPPGLSTENISFVLLLNNEGKLIDVNYDMDKKRLQKMSLNVPQGVLGKSGTTIKPDFLWGNTKYILGWDGTGKNFEKHFEATKDLFHKIAIDIDDDDMKAVLNFMDNWDINNNPKDHPILSKHWDNIAGEFLVFRMDGKNCFVHNNSKILLKWFSYKPDDSVEGINIVSNRKEPIARIHDSIKNINDPGGQAEKRLISFNDDSYESYNKTQSFNASLSDNDMFAYTKSLNYLLRDNSRQKIQIGDATTVFWTERESPVENFFYGAIAPESYSDADNKQVKDFLNAARNGKKLPDIDLDVGFYILGLSPNASRLSVRFWYISTVGEIQKKLGEHIKDMEIERNFPDKESKFPGIRKYLLETLSKNIKKDRDSKLNPLLSGAFTRSVLTGEAYPRELLAQTLNVIRADIGSDEYNCGVNYYRASLIKGYLSRYYKKIIKKDWEVSMSLNTELKDSGYRLGRLFAVLEKAQEDSVKPAKLNATIKDRYFSSASATPRSVFPILQRLSNHHTSKLPDNYRIYYEKLKQEIIDGIDPINGFKAHMNLEEQGMFMLGYYQQRKALFTSNEEK